MRAFRSVFVVTFISMGLIACSSPKAFSQVTLTSSSVRATFNNTTPGEVLARLAKKCDQIGSAVKEINVDSIVCARLLSDADAELVNISSETTRLSKPENRMKFITRQAGRNVIVTTQQWAEISKSFGQSKRIDLSHFKQKENMRKIMVSMGGTV
jgi:hypothetical protein